MFEDILTGGSTLTGPCNRRERPHPCSLVKSVIKAGMMAYDEAMVALSELNEQAGDIFAEVRSEMATTDNGSAESRGEIAAANAAP